MVKTAKQNTKRIRSCIACGKKDEKKALLRIVRGEGNVVAFDETGRAAGRGAYVCDATCFAKACKTGKLARALRTHVSEQDIARISHELSEVLCADNTAVSNTAVSTWDMSGETG